MTPILQGKQNKNIVVCQCFFVCCFVTLLHFFCPTQISYKATPRFQYKLIKRFQFPFECIFHVALWLITRACSLNQPQKVNFVEISTETIYKHSVRFCAHRLQIISNVPNHLLPATTETLKHSTRSAMQTALASRCPRWRYRSRLVDLDPIIYYDVSSKMPSNTITMKATGQLKWGAVQPWQRLLSQLPRGNQLPWHVARGQVVSPIELVGRQHQFGRHHQGLWQGGRHYQVGQHHQGGGDQLAGQRWPEAKLWTTSSFQTCEISSPTDRED